jgi:hypothetical protein
MSDLPVQLVKKKDDSRLLNDPKKSGNKIMSDEDMEQAIKNMKKYIIDEKLDLERTYDPLEPIMSSRKDIGRMFYRIRNEICNQVSKVHHVNSVKS